MEFDDVILSHPHDFFRFKRHAVEPGTCFILMPFSKEFDIVFDTIVDSLKGQMVCTRADDLRLGKNILERILLGIATSELIIADLTGRNPNVFYELALAHTYTKNILLLTQNMDDVPFDLRPLFCHEYNCNSEKSLSELSSIIQRAAQDVSSKRLPQMLEGALNRTKRIVDYMEQLLNDRERCRGLIIRIQAGLSSLGNKGESESSDRDLRRYGRYLEDERELLVQLLENGAILQAIISPQSVTSGGQETPKKKIARINRVLSFLTRKDASVERCQMVISPERGTNLFFFGDQIMFEGHNTEIQHGIGWTMVFSDPQLIQARISIFDRLFESARRYTINNFGHGKQVNEGPKALLEAVILGLQTAEDNLEKQSNETLTTAAAD